MEVPDGHHQDDDKEEQGAAMETSVDTAAGTMLDPRQEYMVGDVLREVMTLLKNDPEIPMLEVPLMWTIDLWTPGIRLTEGIYSPSEKRIHIKHLIGGASRYARYAYVSGKTDTFWLDSIQLCLSAKEMGQETLSFYVFFNQANYYSQRKPSYRNEDSHVGWFLRDEPVSMATPHVMPGHDFFTPPFLAEIAAEFRVVKHGTSAPDMKAWLAFARRWMRRLADFYDLQWATWLRDEMWRPRDGSGLIGPTGIPGPTGPSG